MRTPLNDQLRELAQIANDRAMDEAASLLLRLARQAVAFRPAEGERFDPVEELFFRDIRGQSPEREPELPTNWADNAARISRAVSGPGERTLRAGCEALVREWSELGEIGLSAKAAGRQLQQLLTAVGGG